MPGSPSAVGPLFFWTGGAPRGALGGLANTGFGGSGGFCNPSSEIDIGFVGSIVTIFVAGGESIDPFRARMSRSLVTETAALGAPGTAGDSTLGACAMAIAGIRPKRDINSLVFIRLLLIFAW